MRVHPLMKALSSETNLEILGVLSSGSFHPRELARILQKDETDVSRRLRTLEKLGLVEGRWIRVGDKNVKIYSLRADEIKLELKPGEIHVQLGENESGKAFLKPRGAPRVENFVGREEELAFLRSSRGVVVIYGMAGIGKTSLAARAFPSAYWYSFIGLEDFYYLAWQIGLFLNSLGWTDLTDYLRSGDREESDVFEMIKSGLEKTGGTLVLDDLHKCTDEKVSRLLSYLAGMKNGRVVVTTRVKPNLGAEGVTYIHLKGLKPEETYMLARLKGREITPEEFADIYSITLGHPLALNLLVESQIRGRSGENLFDFLFGEVYRELDGDERLMLSILALFDEPVEYEAIKALYGKKNAFPVLYSLLKRGLVERKGNAYSIHELLRGFVRNVSSADERAYYAAYSDYLARKISPPDFLKAMKYAIASGDRDRVRKLVALRIQKVKQVVTDFPRAYLRVLSLLPDEPAVKLEMGMIYFQKGLFEKARKLWAEAEEELEGPLRLEVESLLADICMELGDLDCAGRHLKETEALARELNDRHGWLSYYMELTKYEFYMENLDKALESAFKELEIVKELGNIEEEPLVLLHVGDIYSPMGEREKAVEYYVEALKLSEAYGMRFIEYTAYMELAKAHYSMGRYEKAVEYATRAVDYFMRIRNYRRAVDAMAYRCVSYIGLGELEMAERDAKELVRIAHSTNYPLAWAGYIFLGAIKDLRGENGSEYRDIAKRHLKDNEWLYEAVLEELKRLKTSAWQTESRVSD